MQRANVLTFERVLCFADRERASFANRVQMLKGLGDSN